MRATFLRTAMAAALLAIIAIAGASPAWAHAQLLSTEPTANTVLEAPPGQVVLTFNEPVGVLAMALVDPGRGNTDLLGQSSGGPVVAVRLPAELVEGTYVLNWRVASEDGHVVAGSLLFSIGKVSGASASAPEVDVQVAALVWVAKVAVYLGLFFGVGGAIFRLLGPVPEVARRSAGAAIVLGLAAAVLSLGLQGLDALGLPLPALAGASPWVAGLSTAYGVTVVALVVAYLLAGLALLLPRGRIGMLIGVLAWVVGAASLSLSGHASAADPQWLMRPAVFVHVAGILFWVGALLPLALMLKDRSATSQRALARFSCWIPYAVAPLVISGMTLAVVQLGAPGPQWMSGYGAILAAKLALLGALFALALWNRIGLTTPALNGQGSARHRLQLSVRAEIVLVLLILAVVALWRFTVPPRALAVIPSLAPIALHVMNETTMAMVTISPGQSGPVRMAVVVTDMSGEPTPAEGLTVILTEPSMGIAPLKHVAELDNGVWTVEDGAIIPVAGIWQVEVDVRLDRFTLLKLVGAAEIP